MAAIRGKFLTVEGTEGVGKSTQCERLAVALERDFGVAVTRTREPGGTRLGETLRTILLDPELPAMGGTAELLLMFAARAEHLDRVIRPALAAGRWVVCDRFTDATYAYQGGGRALDTTTIAELENLVQDTLRPDLTIVLDLDVERAMARIEDRAGADRFERERREFFERVRSVYLQRARIHPERMVVVDAGPAIEAVHASIMQVVRERIA